MNLSIDTLFHGKFQIRQPEKGFRVSIDTLLLAAACPAQKQETVLDVGAGSGAAGLLLLYRQPQLQITGVELHPEMTLIAQENAQLNKMTNQYTILHQDIFAPSANLKNSQFDHVISNPPFTLESGATPSPNSYKTMANIENAHSFCQKWLEFCCKRLKNKGSLTIIHRADRLHDLLAGLPKNMGRVTIIPLWPYAEKPAKRVILQAIKGSKAGTIMHPGFILHPNNEERFTPLIQDVLYNAQPLPI